MLLIIIESFMENLDTPSLRLPSLAASGDFESIKSSLAAFGRENRVTLIWLSTVLIVACFSVVTCIGCVNTYRYIIR